MLKTLAKKHYKKLEKKVQSNQNYINHIESNQGTPSLAGIFYICEFLGITPSEFFDIDNNNPAKLKKINEYLKKLDDEQLEMVENLVKNLANK